MNVGNKIKTLRTEQGLSLPNLAKKAAVSKGFLYQLESGEKENVSLVTLNKLASALAVTLADLLEKHAVTAKRVIPEKIDPALSEYIQERHKAYKPIPEYILNALYAIQERKGKNKTKEDWAYLCTTLERNTE